jgi:MiaB-like tRNA modifying enzyme
VKGPSVGKALKLIKELHQNNPGKKIIAAGCLLDPIIKKIKEIDSEISILTTHNIDKIVSIVEEVIHDNPEMIVGKKSILKINLPKKRKNPSVGIIPISSGCEGNCSYCSVKIVKGGLDSYPPDKIIEEYGKCIRDNCKEIWITAQDSGAYNHFGLQLPGLMNKLLKLDNNVLFRIGMMNPNHVIPIIDELIEVYKSKKVFKFLHIPIQSGSDKVLKDMNRQYNVKDVKEIINRFRKEIHHITISTDIICGYPTETREDFQKSIDLIQKIKPDILNISRFVKRPGTEAEKLKPLDTEEVKNRSRRITSEFEYIAFNNNKKWKDWRGTILIDEKGKDNTWIGRNLAYKPIIVEGDLKLGELIKVRVIETTSYDLRATVLN